MLLVKVLKEALRQVPVITNGIMKMVEVQKWDEDRKKLAVDILWELKQDSVCEPKESTIEIVDGRFGPLYLTFIPTELDKISIERDMNKIVEYVKDVIKDINELTCDIVLEYDDYNYDESDDVFEAEICWYI